MKSYTEYLTFNIPARMAFENITPLVQGKYSSPAVRVVARTAIVAVGLAAGTSLPR
jgi:hypothetical protein